MTTNQTIDGVPGLRSLIERVTSQELGMSAKKDRAEAAHELRALLDADKVNNRQMGLMQYVEAHPIKPAAQPQGEPVAWRGCNADGEVVTEWIDGVPPERMTDLCGNAARFDKIERAYAEQPAPVAVTLSHVLTAYDYAESHPHKYLRGTSNWCAAVAYKLNACLDELKRLNPSLQPIPLQSQPL